MKQYNCPDCTHVGDSCYDCPRFLGFIDKYNQILTQSCSYKSIDIIPDACKNCSNHPSNGGDGICFCTLGLSEITY